MPLLNTTYVADNLEDAVAYVLTNSSVCTTLHVIDRDLSDQDVVSLCAALARNEYIESLDVGHNNIGVVGAKALAKNTTLRALDLSCNAIGEEGAAALADNTTLRKLSVFSNELGCFGYDYGVYALSRNHTLEFLNIGGNGIGDNGAEYFADHNHTLKSLMLDDNNIEDQGAFRLSFNRTLTFVSMADNDVSDEILDMLNQTIRLNKERRQLVTIADQTFFQRDESSDVLSSEEDGPAAKRQRMG